MLWEYPTTSSNVASMPNPGRDRQHSRHTYTHIHPHTHTTTHRERVNHTKPAGLLAIPVPIELGTIYCLHSIT